MKKIIVGQILKKEKVIGTGFLVSQDIFMTVKHNVLTADDLLENKLEEKEIVVQIGENDIIIGKTINLLEAVDKGIDCVLIRLNEILAEEKVQVLVNPDVDITDYNAHIMGYPKLVQNKFELIGKIVSDNAEELLIHVNKENQLQNYEGLSGAPVSVLGDVVGIITRQLNCEKLEALPVKYIASMISNDSMHIETKKMPLAAELYEFDLKELQKKTRQVISSAGPRYSTDLNVKTETFNNLSFLLRKDSANERLGVIDKHLGTCVEKLSEFLSYKQNDEFVVLKENKDIVTSSIKSLQDNLVLISTISQEETAMQTMVDQLNFCKQQLEKVFKIEKDRFEERNGAGTYNNMSWRGFQASYMCAFPAHYLDELKDVIRTLQEIDRLLDLGLLKNISKHTILINGKGGIGKTHLLCDIVNIYLENSLPAILLFGEIFNMNETPDTVIMNMFRRGEDIEKLFVWLNEYGNKNNVFIPICIDAINETKNNAYWNNNLPLLLARVEPYTNIKIIVSCRDIYLDEYLDEEKIHNMLQISHNGFSNMEVDALSSFCGFYGVNINYDTTCIPEFMNPLFLKMLCEIANSKEDKTVIVEDIQVLMDDFFEIKNKIIAKQYSDYFSVRDNVVRLALDNITQYMADNDQYNITWKDLRSSVSKVLKEFGAEDKTSGFIKLLISENLLRESDEDTKQISFAYQKFYEYLYSKKYVDVDINIIIDSVENRKITLGTLEMIQIEFYRRNHEEFLSKIGNRIHGEAVESFMNGLYWRQKADVGKKTIFEIERLFYENQEADVRRIIFGLLSVSTKMKCPVNAYYIHHKLKTMNNYKRDYLLSFFLLKQYDQIKIIFDLCERAIYLDKPSFCNESILLWKIILCWGTGLNDIKLRDRASKGLANLFKLYPSDAISIVTMFEDINDDYIHERIWQAIYSALIILDQKQYIVPVMEYIEKHIIETGDWPQNVLIRDYLRNIFEFAYYKKWCTSKKVELVRPPYTSKKHDPNPKWASMVEKNYSRLYWNCQNSDFAIYSIPSDVEDYSITKKEVGLLIFEDIVKSGYTSSVIFHAKYDEYINYTFGSLRSRDGQVERIGKKYQKIYLYREMGNIYDNYKYSPRHKYDEVKFIQPEQGNQFRHIDLTILTQKNNFKGKSLEYPFFRYAKWKDLKWFENNDIEKYVADLFSYKDCDEEFYILQGYVASKESGKKAYREIWAHIRTYFFKKNKKEALLGWLKNKDFEGRWMPEGYGQLYECCVGEYPWSPTMINYLGQEEEQNFGQEKSAPCYLYTTVNDYIAEKDSQFCEDVNAKSYMFPSKFLFEKMDLFWNGSYGYNSKGKTIIYIGKNNAIYINKRFIKEFLEENALDVVWTVLGEKQKITGGIDFPGRSEFSYSYFVNNDEMITKNHEMFNVFKAE